MIILIHASLDKRQEMIDAKKRIESVSNHTVILPELTRYQHIRDEEKNDRLFDEIKHKLTDENIKNVENADALLILNHDHRGIQNYIGGNSFLEMVVAYYLRKPIYLLNPIPIGMPYTEEIRALFPIVIDSLDYFSNLD